MPEQIYLIDGNAYIHRAYHAVAPLTTRTGLPTNAAFGFINILLRVIREKQPHYLAVAFDSRGPTFRHERYPEYKANRPPMDPDLAVQIPYIKKVVAAYNIYTMEQAGVEADDLLASAAGILTAAGCKVIVVSGDKDLLQLVSSQVTVWDPMQDKVMDYAAVLEKYQVEPHRLRDLFGLIGDHSDNIPGVPGIGPKTAAKLLADFASLEEIYSNLDQIKGGKLPEKIAAARDLAFLSRELVTLKADIPVSADIEEYRLSEPDFDKIKEIFSSLEFSSLLKSEVPLAAFDRRNFQLIQNQADFQDLLETLAAAASIGLDTETSSLDPLTAELVGISICATAEMACYIPLGHKEDGRLRPDQLDTRQVLAALAPLLQNAEIPKICHNLKFDYAVLKTHGLRLAGPLYDTMLASYLLDPSRNSHKLDLLCEEYLDRRMTSYAEVTGQGAKQINFSEVAIQAAGDYSCEDVLAAFLLWQQFKPLLEEYNLWKLFLEIETPLIPILAEMEGSGIRVDSELLKLLSREFADELIVLDEKIFTVAGTTFNLNSPKQLAEILFDRLQLAKGRKTKTGFSTDMKVLERLARKHELPALIITRRNVAKLKSTYTDSLLDQIHPLTGRIHTSFNQTVTATGRLSSSNPNLQNIPIRSPEGQRIREAFIPEDGWRFLAADYSQIDLRVMAHYSGDPALVTAFRKGRDIHNQTAGEIFQVNPAFITPEMRRVAKTINFGIVYGMSAFGLADQLDLQRREAEIFISRYFELYSGVRQFMDDIIVQARRDGYVTTLFNRIRRLPEIHSKNRNRREFAERTAINTPIQGTAADIIKVAAITAAKAIAHHRLQTRMLLQIHDELVFEVPESEVEEVTTLVRDAMENVISLAVPLTVNITTAGNLAKT